MKQYCGYVRSNRGTFSTQATNNRSLAKILLNNLVNEIFNLEINGVKGKIYSHYIKVLVNEDFELCEETSIFRI